MIGLLANARDLETAREFFQLFKTPWEQYRDDHRYDVVISSDGRVPAEQPRLLLQYGSRPSTRDREVAADREPSSPLLTKYAGLSLPIYGSTLVPSPSSAATPILSAGDDVIAYRDESGDATVVRIGYDLFHEVDRLLATGQPRSQADSPTVDLHIALLRDEILRAGVPLLEIPAVPAGHAYFACLTHDIDFVGIREHILDHTMWGFAYRSTVGALIRFVRGALSFRRMLECWLAVLKLPLVYLGLARDFWLPFEWYLRVEKGIPATYYFIPYRNRAGDKVPATRPAWRAAKYDVTEIPQWVSAIRAAGNEIGLHGIDAWHSVAAARDEMQRVSEAADQTVCGIRMHWLLQDEHTYGVLDEAGIAYDSTAGYNDAVGYRSGTTQVFRPPGTRTLLELPLHIQDGAMFFPDKLGLSDAQAWKQCEQMIGSATRFGGVLTVLWHDRSHGPERFWGDFYLRLLERLRGSGACFASASQTVEWFRQRRDVEFRQLERADGSFATTIVGPVAAISPPLRIRRHLPRGGGPTEDVWSGIGQPVFEDSSGRLVMPVRDRKET